MSLRRNIRWRQIPKVKRITFVNGRKRTILVRPSPLPRGKPDVRNVAAVVDTINNGPASSNVPTSTPGTSSTYIERRQMLFSAWENLRPQLLATRLEEMAPASSICILCKDTVAGIVRCLDCGPTAYYCPTCAHSSHEHIMFHTPQIWKGSMYIPLKMSSVFKRAEHNCASQYNSTVFAVDITGKQHKICVAFCRCEDMAVTLLRYNLWPATPTSPRVAFDLKFMELLAVLQLECHLSARSFCEAISYMCSYFIHPSSTDMVTSIYRAVVGDCLSEYHVHRSSLNSRNGVTESTIGRECPVCLQNPPLVSMDANFGLVHKASSGHEMPARNKNLLYKHQGHLKDFIDDYSADRKKPGAIKEDTKAMRKEVASHMNTLYSTAIGKAQAFPYKKVADGSIQIVGLPEEVLQLRVMSHYGVENLKLLLNCQEITVSVGEAAASTETTEAAGTSETTEAAASTETPEDTGSIGPSENSDNHTISEEDVRVLAPLLLGRDVSIVDTVEDADSERRSEMTKRKCRNAKGRKVKPTKKMKKELNLSMYDVERITDMRCKNQEQQYFIKWLGYPDTENTWEPEKNIPVDIVNSYLST